MKLSSARINLLLEHPLVSGTGPQAQMPICLILFTVIGIGMLAPHSRGRALGPGSEATCPRSCTWGQRWSWDLNPGRLVLEGHALGCQDEEIRTQSRASM